MFCDIEMEDLAATMLDDEKAVQDSKSDCGHREEVHGRDDFAVVVKKSRPEFAGLIGRRQAAKISRHGTLRDFETKLEKLAVNSWGAPARILLDHPPDNSPHLGIDLWPADALGP